jgi:peptide methionine sulfoxide reductase MsrA
METIYIAGGCLWGVQEFLKHLPGVDPTGRANENPLKQPMMVMQNVSKQPLTLRLFQLKI